MIHHNLIKLAAMAALVVSFSAQAHDPKEHMMDAEKPDCAAMENMEQGKMKKDDPVMQAMQEKCMKGMNSMQDMHDMHHGEEQGMMSDSKQQKKASKQDEHAGHH